MAPAHESGSQEFESLRARHFGIRYRRRMPPILLWAPLRQAEAHAADLRPCARGGAISASAGMPPLAMLPPGHSHREGMLCGDREENYCRFD
jgi:hypothetical protein